MPTDFCLPPPPPPPVFQTGLDYTNRRQLILCSNIKCDVQRHVKLLCTYYDQHLSWYLTLSYVFHNKISRIVKAGEHYRCNFHVQEFPPFTVITR